MNEKMRRGLGIRILGLIVAVSFASAICNAAHADEASDKTYSIKLDSPVKVGQKSSGAASGSQRVHSLITVGTNAPVHQDQDLAVKLTGESETLAVDSKGQVTKAACTIKTFVKSDGTEILPAGSVVTVEGIPLAGKGETTQYSLKEGTLSLEQMAALKLVLLGCHTPESPTTSEMFGTDKPQKIGGTWPINSKLFAASLPVPVKPEDLSGEFTLAAITKVDGVDYFQVRGHVSARDFESPMPPGWKISNQKLEMKLSVLIPVDDSVVSSVGTMDVNVTFAASGANPAGVSTTVESSMNAHYEGSESPITAK